jgi:hypothetical protein
MPGACCPGKSNVRQIIVGGQSVGISQLDQVLRATKALEAQDEYALKEFMRGQLKIHNYIPPGSEQEYLDAVWQEYLKIK